MSDFLAEKRPEDPGDRLAGRRLVLVVTGGVAAYKAADLARRLTRAGAQVRTVLTENAARFVTPLTFESLTGQPAALDMWAARQVQVEHIAWADWAEAVVVAPATANFLAKMAQGLADDFASTFMLAYEGPKLVAPAMNSKMLAHPATRANLDRLREWGVRLVEPAEGLLACGTVGAGRLPEPEHLLLEAARLLTPALLEGRRVVISAGATWEAWDDIRVLTNRSSGLMGRALARAAWLKGARVSLVAGPAAAQALYGVELVPVESTEDMLAAVQGLWTDLDVLIMAAAPADFKPARRTAGKIKKGQTPPPLELAANPDILKTLGPEKGRRVLVGFAAESEDLINRAQAKLRAKNLDLIVANQAGGPESAFGRADNQAWLVWPHKEPEALPRLSKLALAQRILESLEPGRLGET